MNFASRFRPEVLAEEVNRGLGFRTQTVGGASFHTDVFPEFLTLEDNRKQG